MMKLLPILLLAFVLSLGVACASEPASTPVPPIALPTLTFDEEVAQRVREKAIEAAADSRIAAMATAEIRKAAIDRARARSAEASARAAKRAEASVDYNSGHAHYMLGKYELAIQSYDEAIRIDPQFADAYIGRSYAYRQLGNSIKAEQDWAKGKAVRARCNSYGYSC